MGRYLRYRPTREPSGPLWWGLVLFAAGLLLLAVLLTGCGMPAVSAGPHVAATDGLDYQGTRYGVSVVTERPGFRASVAMSDAQKVGSEKQGGAELRLLAGKQYERLGLYAGLRGFAQRSDWGTVQGSNPSLAASWQAFPNLKAWVIYDGPDSTHHDTQAVVLMTEYHNKAWPFVLEHRVEKVWFDQRETGWVAGMGLRWRFGE